MTNNNSNFSFLEQHDRLLSQLAYTAENSFVPDPNTTLVKLRQLGEAIAQDIAARIGIEPDNQTGQFDLLKQIDSGSQCFGSFPSNTKVRLF